MSSPSPSNALGKVAPASDANDVAWSTPSLLTTPTTCTCPPAASENCCMRGGSSRQGPHQLAQRFTTVGTPGARPRFSVPPPRQSKASGGSTWSPVAVTSAWSGQGSVVSSVAASGATPRVCRGDSWSAVVQPASSPARRRAASAAARRPLTRSPRWRSSTSLANSLCSSMSSQARSFCVRGGRGLDQLQRHLRVGGADAVRRAPLREPAGPARRLLGVADAAAVEDHAVGEHRPLALGDQLGDLRLDLDRVLLGGPAEAADQPAEVGVDGQPG